MADFPSNPSNGNTHIIGNTVWVYNSTSDSWLIQDVNEYAVANLENTPPANPDEGTIWYDSQTTGRLYIYIDGNWIDASPGDVSVINGGNDVTATKSGATYTINVDDSFVRNTGDTMTGTLTMSNSNTNFNSTNTGVNWAMNTDGAYIKFFNTGDGDSNSRLEYATFDNGNEYHRWLVNSTERMRVTGSGAKITGNLDLESVNPQITFNGTSDAGVDMAIKATPEGLDFYEPEDGNKIHFQILDDTGVNAPYGYKVNGTTVIDASRNVSATNVTATGNLTVSTSNANSGGIILADDGDIVDLNDGYCSMRFSNGVRVYSGNRSGSVRHTLHSNGTFSATGDVIAFASDNRLKNLEGRVENALDIVDSLNGYYYRFNELAGEFEYDTESRQVGVSAQEVEAVLPEVVKPAPINEGNNTDYKTVQYEKLVPVLIEAIKELRAEIETLKGK